MVELWADSARMTTCGYCRGDSAKLIFNGRTCHMVELKLTVTATLLPTGFALIRAAPKI